MKWREVRRGDGVGFIHPSKVRYVARGGGKSYEVYEAWVDPWERQGATKWWSFDGRGDNKRWATKDAAIAWCEQDAATTKRERGTTQQPEA